MKHQLRRRILIAALVASGGAETAVAQSSGSVTVTINLTITATATVDVAKVQSETRSTIQGFMSRRANLITTGGPDTARAHARLGGGSMIGEGGGSAPGAGLAPSTAPPGMGRGRGGFGSGGGMIAGGDSSGAGLMDGLARFGRGAGGPGLGAARESANGYGGPSGTPFGWQREYASAADDQKRPAASAFRFSGNAEDGLGRFAFATSLGQMRAAAEAHDQARRAGAAASMLGAPASQLEAVATSASSGQDTLQGPGRAASLGIVQGQGQAAPAASGGGRPGSVDVWVEGSSSYYADNRIDGRRQGHAALAHAGADVIVMPGLLLGVMGSLDWMSESATTPGQSRDGRGWMAGPYMSARITRNLYFDARYAWGRSTNHIDPLGAYTDTFATTRQLASAKITGDWSSGAWRFRPSAEVIWYTETAKAYVNAIGVDIAGQTFSLGRTLFGPEIGYRMLLADKSVLEPYLGLKGVWDFSRTTVTTAAGLPAGDDGIRARLEAGLAYRTPGGITIRGSGAYDGLGSDGFRAVQGQARLVVPLQ